MDHERAQELFSAHQDGDLSGEQAERLEAHLETCAACRAEWEAFSGVLALVRGLPAERAPEDFLEKVQRRIRSRSKGAYFRVKAVGPFYFRLPYELFSLLMILVLVALMVLQGMITTIRPEKDPAVRLHRPGQQKPGPGPDERGVLPVRRELIRYRYIMAGRRDVLERQIVALASSFGARRVEPDTGPGLRLLVPRERFKDLTSKLLEGLKFKVERERYFATAVPAEVSLEILFVP